MRLGALIALPFACLISTASAAAMGNARVAALQIELSRRGLYTDTIDGVEGPQTRRAVSLLQRRVGLVADGVAGRQTFAKLGGSPALGRRVLALGTQGVDVAALQFTLAWHGFPSGTFDGAFGAHTDAALRRFQRWAGLVPDGRSGPATAAALDHQPPSSPLGLTWPIEGRVTDAFGPRGARFHSGIDVPAATGVGVVAAGPGRVTWAGWRDGGWGQLVVVAHSNGVRTLYAHLSSVEVRLGTRVGAGFEVGRVGSTGDATGPHLHFEVRLRGAAVDPLTALR